MEIAAPQLLRESAASADPVRMTRDEEIADASFRAADFASLDREHLSVQGCLFTGCLFAGSVLARSQFSDVVFRNCDFSNADLLGCSLHRVRFADCKLSGTNFAETALNHLLFERCSRVVFLPKRPRCRCAECRAHVRNQCFRGPGARSALRNLSDGMRPGRPGAVVFPGRARIWRAVSKARPPTAMRFPY